MTAIAQKLDARGLNCPLPILKTRKAINQINSGEIVEVTSSDPGSVKDMVSFCEQTGNHLVSSNEADNGFVFLIEKA
ncbi:MAG: sulfurtransferase TusA family protein [Gammaproteobacteria bacterium]|nr:sulfurtransferase TusA family protein [Gammaproteobacteria bacterium]